MAKDCYSNPKWREACENSSWVDLQVKRLQWKLGKDGPVWKLLKKLGEEKLVEHDDDCQVATAVYECVATSGPYVGRTEIMKIQMQISGEAQEDVPFILQEEIDALQILAHAHDDLPEPERAAALDKLPAPYMLEHAVFTQETDWWRPGGFFIMIVMRRKFGIQITPDEFWDLKKKKRAEMRMSLFNSYNKLLQLKIGHGDRALRNLLWDFDTTPVQCNIVDFEGTDFLDEPGQVRLKSWYVHCEPWGLTVYDYGRRQYQI